MRSQAFENLLIMFEDAVLDNDMGTLKNLVVKSKMLRDRGNTSSSVLRELTNR